MTPNHCSQLIYIIYDITTTTTMLTIGFKIKKNVLNLNKGKVMFYIAQYTVRRTAKSALHFTL